MKVIRRTTFAIAFSIVSVSVMVSGRQIPGINADRSGLANSGYDAVAYMTKGAAIKGHAELEYRWHNLTLRFESAEHRNRFAQSPEVFAPQFVVTVRGPSAAVTPLTSILKPGAWSRENSI